MDNMLQNKLKPPTPPPYSPAPLLTTNANLMHQMKLLIKNIKKIIKDIIDPTPGLS